MRFGFVSSYHQHLVNGMTMWPRAQMQQGVKQWQFNRTTAMISLGSTNVRNSEITKMTNKHAATEIPPGHGPGQAPTCGNQKKLVSFETCTLVNQRQ